MITENEVKKMGIPVIGFKFLKRMITQVDEEEQELDRNSTNDIEAELAKSSEEIDKKFANYGTQTRAQRKKILEETKVTKEQLNKNKAENNKEKTVENKEKQHDREIGD